MKKIELDDLPKYSPWVNRILGIEPFGIHYKNPKEIQREYNQEKWFEILKHIEDNSKIKIDELESSLFHQKECVGYSIDNGIYIQSTSDFHKDQLELYFSVVEPYIKNANSLIELGAGYGSMIINLMKKFGKEKLQYFAGEYTENGIKCIRKLAQNENLKIKTGYCDFFSLKNDEIFGENEKNIIFTSYALMYIPLLADQFIEYIISMNPKVCIHFEPCYEHYKDDSLYGMMCKRYIEMNDYNRNLISILKKAEKDKKIEIIEEQKNIFGNNALLPISIIVWKPIL